MSSIEATLPATINEAIVARPLTQLETIPATKPCHVECRRIGPERSSIEATLEASGKHSLENDRSRESGTASREPETFVVGDA